MPLDAAALSTFHLLGDRDAIGPFIFSCEHASNELPATYEADESDRTLLADHWGWDIGASNVVRFLVSELACRAVLGSYSRLIIDLNRDPASQDLFLTEADGRAISFNRQLTEREREAREQTYFAPYHQAIEGALTRRIAASPSPVTLVSVHSFTPVFRGTRRTVEVGVLYDEHDAMAIELANGISRAGLACALNEPYSGKPPDGLIYSAGRHGRAHQIPYVELEIRQDLIATDVAAAALAAKLVDPLRSIAAFRE